MRVAERDTDKITAPSPCDTCNVPGVCNPRHVDCGLSDQERDGIEEDRGDAAYHARVDARAGGY